jgi:metal-responsive CopG/Arc/MetJ family transcriptional regulator
LTTQIDRYTFSMKTAISIPDLVFNKAERYAKINGLSRSELFTIAIKQFVETNKLNEITEKLNSIYSEEPNVVEKEISKMQTTSVFKEQW